MKRGGFTLVELMLVLLILAIAAAAVTVRAQGSLRGARMNEVLSAFRDFDRTTRAAARNQDRPFRLVVSLSGGTIARADGEGRLIRGQVMSLPSDIRFDRLLVRRQDCRDGDVTISCSRKGFTPTYAVLLKSSGRSQWLVVAGLTGDMLLVADEKQARNILEAGGGNDAG